MPDLTYERRLIGPVCGVDEVGRGPLAGPVYAAAVIVDPDALPPGLDDSKKLTARRRVLAYAAIMAVAEVGVGCASVAEIETHNILRASHIAMCRAIAALPRKPAHALIDGNLIPKGLDIPATALVKGDGISLSIAAASIIAKVTRDGVMAKLAQDHPGYGWETNMGYPSAAHRAALRDLGVTQHHRRSFAPIHKILVEEK